MSCCRNLPSTCPFRIRDFKDRNHPPPKYQLIIYLCSLQWYFANKAEILLGLKLCWGIQHILGNAWTHPSLNPSTSQYGRTLQYQTTPNLKHWPSCSCFSFHWPKKKCILWEVCNIQIRGAAFLPFHPSNPTQNAQCFIPLRMGLQDLTNLWSSVVLFSPRKRLRNALLPTCFEHKYDWLNSLPRDNGG